jgi:hypothetical protein
MQSVQIQFIGYFTVFIFNGEKVSTCVSNDLLKLKFKII